MVDTIIPLVVLFLVIFDPLASFAVLLASISNLKKGERNRIIFLSIFVAAALSYGVLLIGAPLLEIFRTSIEDFKLAGGVILSILGIKMSLGYPLANIKSVEGNSMRGIAAIIGTPLLTGPAAIAAIISSTSDYGVVPVGIAITIALSITAIIFLQALRIRKIAGTTGIQVVSTLLGLITLSWGIGFIRAGLGI